MKKEMTEERAAALVNDIHEGCCRASRKTLMEVASFYKILCSVRYSEIKNIQSRILIKAMEHHDEIHRMLKEPK